MAGAWERLRSERRAALIPYVTAGYPDAAASLDILRAAGAHGDIVEVGVPFSDPVADGPTIQRAAFQALDGGMTLAGTLRLVREAALDRPVVLFSYVNPVLRYGVERLLEDAVESGASALLLCDVPAGADPVLESAVARSPLALVRMVAPTTRDERLRRIARGARGFIYLVARLGVTGASPSLADDLAASVARVRAATPLPVAVGFGISTPEQARVAGRVADGVVVGSALVEVAGRSGADGVAQFLSGLRAALAPGAAA